MSDPVVMFVSFQALPGQSDELRARLHEMTKLTRMEDGCLQYDLHVDAADASRLYFYEQWRDRAAHAAHDQTAHVQAFRRDQEKLVKSIDFINLSLVRVAR